MANKPRKALGRGLGALIPGGPSDEAPAAEGQKTVRIDLIRANPKQPRRDFDEEALAELAQSITEVGLIEPIVVRPAGDGYEIIAGERRWRACQKAGITEVPVAVREATDREVLILALVENLQREDLNPIEIAEAYQRMADEFDFTQEQIAQRVGKERATVANMLRLLKLAPQVQQWVREGAVSMGHARAIAVIEDKARQQAVAKQCIDKGLNVRQLEALLRAEAEEPQEKKAPAGPADPNLRAVIERLKRTFGTKVTLAGKADQGKLTFEYYSSEEFDRLLEKLLS